MTQMCVSRLHQLGQCELWNAGSKTGTGKGTEREEPMIGPKPASAAERKAQAAAEAKERSDRILEEERAKDKAWRQAVLMVSWAHLDSTQNFGPACLCRWLCVALQLFCIIEQQQAVCKHRDIKPRKVLQASGLAE